MRNDYIAPEILEIGTANELVLGPTDTEPADNALGYSGFHGE